MGGTLSFTNGRVRPKAVVQFNKKFMDESTQLSLLLSAVSKTLPREVLHTCESLNSHGEWEMALDHCVFHLAQVSPTTKMDLMACAQRFRASAGVLAAIETLPCV